MSTRQKRLERLERRSYRGKIIVTAIQLVSPDPITGETVVGGTIHLGKFKGRGIGSVRRGDHGEERS
ncbi:MAG: hypothetical protein AAGG47_13000 [Pseudomonadota bacterium]